MLATRWPPWPEPADNRFLRPMAMPLSERSIVLLEIKAIAAGIVGSLHIDIHMDIQSVLLRSALDAIAVERIVSIDRSIGSRSATDRRHICRRYR